MIDRILLLHEGNPRTGIRGGDVYWQHLLAALAKKTEVVSVNRAALGITQNVTGAQYATALEKYLSNIAWRAPVLHDGSSFYVMTESNRMLKRNGFGPIVSLMQEWLPAREQTFRMRVHLHRYMFKFMHSVDAHVAVSHWLKQRIMRMGISGSRVDVALPGVPDSCFESAAHVVRTPSPRLRVVTAGIYHPAKGQLLLVEAMGIIARRSPELLNMFDVDMYGTINSTNQAHVDAINKRVAELQLGAVVRINGHISQQELFAKFATSDVFAFTAVGEGLGLVVLESMLHGCVPVVNRSSAMAELLDWGRLGMTIENSPASLASALDAIRGKLQSDCSLPETVAAGARSQALTWDEAASACASRIIERMAPK